MFLPMAVIFLLLGLRESAKQTEDSVTQKKTIAELTSTVNIIKGNGEKQLAQNIDLDASMKAIASAAKINPNQSTKALADEIIKRISKQPRHLTETQRQNITRIFTSLAHDFPELMIGAPGDPEAQAYAKEFADAFNAIGIKVARVGFLIQTSNPTPNSGLQIVIKNFNHVPSNANVFFKGMLDSGIKVVGGTLDTLSDDQFELVVASIP